MSQLYMLYLFLYLFSLVYLFDVCSSSRRGKAHSFLKIDRENRAACAGGYKCDDPWVWSFELIGLP